MSLLIVSLVEFLMGSLLHFVFDLCPTFLVSIVAPVNESIFEHLKLALFPMLLIGLFFIFFRVGFNDSSMTALLVGIITALFSVVLIYYFYRYGLNIESVIVDIILLFVAIIIGNIMSIYVYHSGLSISKWVVLFMLILLIFFFMAMTYFPFNLPLFIDNSL